MCVCTNSVQPLLLLIEILISTGKRYKFYANFTFSDFIPRLGGMHMFECYSLCWRIDGRQWTRGYHEIEFRWCGTNAVGEEVPTEL